MGRSRRCAFRTLEQRISTALTEDNSNPLAIAALISETETAIVAADQDAKLEQERVLDPLASPDPKAAREACARTIIGA
jgi:hypothetical protein